MKTFADAEAVLANTLPGYESRPQQQDLAAFVEQTLDRNGLALAEAGCGTGKSLATMIPAILSGKRTIVATATIALMEQYANKDVPFLQEHLGKPFTWALLKGRSNYFCWAKDANATSTPALEAMRAELAANPEHSGDREHFASSPSKEDFRAVSMSSAECPGKRECPFADSCFAEAAKEKASEAQVVITNTAMLMVDLVVRKISDGYASMLGSYQAVAIDEAHELEEIATNALSTEISEASIRKLVSESQNWINGQGGQVSANVKVSDAVTDIWSILPDAGIATLSFFLEHEDAFVSLVEGLGRLAEEIGDTEVKNGDGVKGAARRSQLVKRAYNLRGKIIDLISADEDELVRWVEEEKRYVQGRGQMLVKLLKTAPISVAPFLTETLWTKASAVLVSATLSVNGSFDYIQDRLGLAHADTLRVGTPFNYQTQSMLFVPDAGAPNPKKGSMWRSYAQASMLELIDASKGGALLLFTSRSAMEEAYQALQPALERRGNTALMQGKHGSNKEIARTFQHDTHSVLFALKSFFTGVDFAGDTCRLVIIDKLAFAVPTDPMLIARSNQIERRGGSAFRDLAIPGLVLTMNQAFGRLIRTKADHGVVAILDSRLTSTAWGRSIVGALPDAPATTDLDGIRGFYATRVKEEVPV